MAGAGGKNGMPDAKRTALTKVLHGTTSLSG